MRRRELAEEQSIRNAAAEEAEIAPLTEVLDGKPHRCAFAYIHAAAAQTKQQIVSCIQSRYETH